MIVRVLIDVLLALTVIVEVLSVVGLLVLRTTMQRLHVIGPATVVAPVLAGVAVAFGTHATGSQAMKGIIIAFVLALFGGVLSHETGRAALSHETGPT